MAAAPTARKPVDATALTKAQEAALLEDAGAVGPEDAPSAPGAPGVAKALPDGVRLIRDVPYGAEPLQTMDVYAPPRARDAPAILMVHGGAWMLGDKTAPGVVEQKVARWVSRGFVFISVNYRLVPQASPLEQARDVARALAAAQDRAADWGAARQRFILMGHSSGAHLVALLAASSTLATSQGAAPWLGTVLLDSAALDVPRLMEAAHPRFYDRVFGRDAAGWALASPSQQLKQAGAPVLAVCASGRAESCPQARQFVARASALGTRAMVLEQPLSHKDINTLLGDDSAYTRAVEAYLKGFDVSVARLLEGPR